MFKKLLKPFITLVSLVFAISAIVGATLGCVHALILLVVPAIVLVYTIISVSKKIKNKAINPNR